jgi:hypothetical protein
LAGKAGAKFANGLAIFGVVRSARVEIFHRSNVRNAFLDCTRVSLPPKPRKGDGLGRRADWTSERRAATGLAGRLAIWQRQPRTMPPPGYN